jgi:FG-GAP-like repeat/Matrixin
MVFDSLNSAKQSDFGSSIRSEVGAVSSFDKTDFYRFDVKGNSGAYLSLSDLSVDASLTLMDATGKALSVSNRPGAAAEAININLAAGTYYICVGQVSSNTTYKLNLSSNGAFANINENINWLSGDFNGDGFEDVLRQEQGAWVDGVNDVQFFLGTSNGGFQSAVNVANMNSMHGNGVNLIAGDFNGDGRTDLIRQEKGTWVDSINDVQILRFQNGNFQTVADLRHSASLNGNYVNLIASDFNGDGRTDLLRQEKDVWVDGYNDVQVMLSKGGWEFTPSMSINHMGVMTGNSFTLAASGSDLMRLEAGTFLDGINDVQFTSFVNGNFSALVNNPTDAFSSVIVAKPWEADMAKIYAANQTVLGQMVDRNATTISPYGTTGRYSAYASGGIIQWSAKTGAVLISAAMANIYRLQGNAASWLGVATGNEYATQGGMRQDFEGGYLFKDANQAVALRPNQLPQFAPTGLILNGLQSSYSVNSTIHLVTGYVDDRNGWNDIAKVDFWLTNAQGQRVELADAASFSYYSSSTGSFQYGASLAGIIAGNYTLRAIAYDKTGLAGASFSQAMSLVAPNLAPTNLQIQGLQTSYDANSTVTISTGFVWDANGWADAAKVDFWLTNSQDQRIELADVTSFSSYDANYARFSYSTSLSGFSVGSYKLCAIAYDKAGLGSNTIAQDFKVVSPNVGPTVLIINGLQSAYNADSTLQLSTSYVADTDGWNDIARVDFWLTNGQGQRVELTDATSFSVNSDFSASFQYGTSLSGVATGNYTFRATAYDKAGLAGASFSQAMSIVALNIAPKDLQIQGLMASYETNATLALSSGFVWDANGWADIAKVDFWVTNSQGQRLELADVTSFSSHDANFARFNYSTSLTSFSAGNYKLCAIAYDKAGLGSNTIAQDFKIVSPNVAPAELVIYGLQSSYSSDSTLQLSTSYAGDGNGWNDIAKVDFWLTNAQGQRVELIDATSFSVNSDFWASFQYGTALSGITAGNYTFQAMAYDKAGLAGALFSQAVSIIQVKPDIDIQIFDHYSAFNGFQRQAFDVAINNWERIITRDKDISGILKIVVTNSATDLNGISFQGSSTIADAYLDSAVDYRNNWSSPNIDLSGIDYHSRVNWNAYTLNQWSFRDLVAVMMHEVGHVLGLNHEENNGDSLMAPSLNPQSFLTAEIINDLEAMGYGVDRNAQIIWNA